MKTSILVAIAAALATTSCSALKPPSTATVDPPVSAAVPGHSNVPCERWNVGLGRERWKVARCSADPAALWIRSITYMRVGRSAKAPQETLTDYFSPGPFETAAKSLQSLLVPMSLQGGIPILGTKVICDGPREALLEWWTGEQIPKGRLRRQERLLPASHNLTLVRYDPDLLAENHLPDGVFLLTYSVPKSRMNDEDRTRWIARLMSVGLRRAVPGHAP